MPIKIEPLEHSKNYDTTGFRTTDRTIVGEIEIRSPLRDFSAVDYRQLGAIIIEFCGEVD
jgi:hypothetical protein